MNATHERPAHLREEQRLFVRLRAGGCARDRDELVRRYLPLARALAVRYKGSSEPLDDLFQVACVGLLQAIDRFDPERGTAFSSFAVPTILGELRRHFRDRTWAIRVPRARQELYLRLEHARDQLTGALGRPPTTAELARRLEATEEDIVQAMELGSAHRAGTLDAPAPAVEHGFERAEDRALLGGLLTVLNAEEAEAVRLRFHEDLTQAAIGQRLGVSQMQVSRLLRRSLARLREAADA